MKNYDKKLKIMLKLKKRLNGKCSKEHNTCPKLINLEFYWGSFWRCGDCIEQFNFLNKSNKKFDCPCYYKISSDLILLRLDEYIEELIEENEKDA